MEISKKCPECGVRMSRKIGRIITRPDGSQETDYYHRCPNCRYEIEEIQCVE